MNRTIELKTFAFLLIATLALCGQALAQKGGERLASEPRPKPAKQPEKKSETPKGDDEKPFDEVVKDMETLKGLFTFYRKAEENRILMEILPEQLDRTCLFADTVDQSVGKRSFSAAQLGGTFPLQFSRDD